MVRPERSLDHPLDQQVSLPEPYFLSTCFANTVRADSNSSILFDHEVDVLVAANTTFLASVGFLASVSSLCSVMTLVSRHSIGLILVLLDGNKFDELA